MRSAGCLRSLVTRFTNSSGWLSVAYRLGVCCRDNAARCRGPKSTPFEKGRCERWVISLPRLHSGHATMVVLNVLGDHRVAPVPAATCHAVDRLLKMASDRFNAMSSEMAREQGNATGNAIADHPPAACDANAVQERHPPGESPAVSRRNTSIFRTPYGSP